MKNFINSILTILTFTFLSCQKKEDKTINNISFYYISSYKEIHIEMRRTHDNEKAHVRVHSKTLDDNNENFPKWNAATDTTFYINKNLFDKLTKSIPSLEKIDTDKAFEMGLDGNTWKIEFGAKGKNQNYIFWSPNYETKKRGLTEFISISKEIYKTANLKKEDFYKYQK